MPLYIHPCSCWTLEQRFGARYVLLTLQCNTVTILCYTILYYILYNTIYTVTFIVYVTPCICRFTPEEKAKRHPCAYLPFGHGPRNCIGMRFALLEVKMALIAMVQKYRIVLAPETEVRELTSDGLLGHQSTCALQRSVHFFSPLYTWRPFLWCEVC